VPLIQAQGSRFDIGCAHGEEVPDLVRETLEWSFGELARAGMQRAPALAGAMKLMEIVQRYTPELVEEVEGIAAGAGISVAEAAVINTRFELLFLDNELGYMPERPRGECTLFGIAGTHTADGSPLIGQNVDLGPQSRPCWVMLCVRPPDGPRVLTATLAGMLAQEGINSDGLALCGSMVRCGGWRTGYPSRKFLRRRVLEQSSVEAAVALIRAAPPRASSHNLLLADERQALVDIETTIEHVHLVEPVDGLLAHANHYLAPEARHENRWIGSYLANSTARYERMLQLLQSCDRPFTPQVVAKFLEDHEGGNRAICRHGDRDEFGSETNVAVIAEPSKRRLHVAFGPACENIFSTYELSESGATVGEVPARRATNQGEGRHAEL
jgi:isopenicillin-N N-acyltransferase-like protein